ncbi:hypothetical protein P7C73_g916, partial [Tremellales sp. Uapishka_1]
MNFQDRGANSVKSLLALLRDTQDGSSQSATPTPLPIQTQATQVPSQAQLDTLLSSLKASSEANDSAYEKPRAPLIEPFGPVASALAGPSRSPSRYAPQPSDENPHRSPQKDAKGKGREEDISQKSFIHCLPLLTELLDTPSFIGQLKKMKAEQDALERRLYAKTDKVKADHAKVVQAEKDVAKISRRSIPSERQLEWKQALAKNLNQLYKDVCLPSIDGLAKRQRAALTELGVPGLGEAVEPWDRIKTTERVARVMDVLEAGLEG